MSNVQNVITLGIGSAPGSIRFFVTLGLEIGQLSAPTARTMPIAQETRVLAVPTETRILAVGR